MNLEIKALPEEFGVDVIARLLDGKIIDNLTAIDYQNFVTKRKQELERGDRNDVCINIQLAIAEKTMIEKDFKDMDFSYYKLSHRRC